MHALQAFFYLHMAETMPADAPDSWFLEPDPTVGLHDKVVAFETQTRALLDDLRDLDGVDTIQSAFYARAKAAFGSEKAEIKAFFEMLYWVMFQQPEGPRWGQFVVLTGKDLFIRTLTDRLNNPLRM